MNEPWRQQREDESVQLEERRASPLLLLSSDSSSFFLGRCPPSSHIASHGILSQKRWVSLFYLTSVRDMSTPTTTDILTPAFPPCPADPAFVCLAKRDSRTALSQLFFLITRRHVFSVIQRVRYLNILNCGSDQHLQWLLRASGLTDKVSVSSN